MKKIIPLFILVFTLVVVLLIYLFRYEYHIVYGNAKRIDRLTGVVQWYCVDADVWERDFEECRKTRGRNIEDRDMVPNKLIESIGSDKASRGDYGASNAVHCYSRDEVIKRAENQGLKCVATNKNGIACGRDKNGDDVVDPWEINWFKVGEFGVCPSGKYTYQD